MPNLVTLDTRKLKVGELERLRRRHIDHYERPLDAAIRLGDLEAFKSALSQTCQETVSFTYNYRCEAQWGLLRESKASFSAMFRYDGPFDIPSRNKEDGDIQHLPDMGEFQLIVLGWAMERSKKSLIDMLLKCDIDLGRVHPLSYQGELENPYNNYGTILHRAAQYSTPAMCSFLLERGADLFQETTQHRTPLDFAIFGMNKDVIDMLCPDATFLERRDSEGCTALLRHCLRHENDKALALEVAKQLVHLGADVKVKDKQQRNALHGAASQLNLALAKWLVDMGVQPHEEDAQGMTPFRYFAHIESWRFSNDPARHEQVEGIYKYLRSLTSDEQVNEVFCSPVKRAWIMTDESLRRRQTLLSAALEAENWTISNLLFQEGAVCPAEKINDPTWLAHGLGIANNQRQKVTFAHLLHSVAPEHRYGLFTVDGGFIWK